MSMISIKKFLQMINDDPTCLERIDWVEETWDFMKERMDEIIAGIYDDNVCDIAIGMMAENYALWMKEGILKSKTNRVRYCLTPEEERQIEAAVEKLRRDAKYLRESTAQHRGALKEWKSKLHNLVREQAGEPAQNTMGAFSRNEEAKDAITHSPDAIIRYVMKLHPTYVSENWKDHYQGLWEKVLQIPEVEAVIYNKGRQQGTTFNRNLVGNILCLMADKGVLCERRANRLAAALENNGDASIRAKLSEKPEKKEITASITEIIGTFLT